MRYFMRRSLVVLEVLYLMLHALVALHISSILEVL
jgi:hypothetical protein